MNELLKQKVEVLNGDRGNREDAAARIKHLRALIQQVPSAPSSRTVTTAPTMDEHNALVADVEKLFAALNAMRVLLR